MREPKVEITTTHFSNAVEALFTVIRIVSKRGDRVEVVVAHASCANQLRIANTNKVLIVLDAHPEVKVGQLLLSGIANDKSVAREADTAEIDHFRRCDYKW